MRVSGWAALFTGLRSFGQMLKWLHKSIKIFYGGGGGGGGGG